MSKLTSLLVILLSGITLSAQDYTHSGSSQSNGGGNSSGSGLEVSGTIGQSTGATLSGGGYTLTGGKTGVQLLVLLPEPDASFELWMSNLPEGQQPPPGQQGPDDTPANDGVSNLFKYALGLLPLVPSADAMPRLVYEGDFMAIEVTRAKDRGVNWSLDFSESLDGWSPTTFSVLVIEDYGDSEKVRLVTGFTAVTNPIAFLQLRLDKI